MKSVSLVLCSPLLLFSLAVAACGPPPQARRDFGALQAEVSGAEIAKTLEGLDYERASGTEGEQKAFAYLEQRLREFGVSFNRYDQRAFLSWPVRGELSVLGPGAMTFKAVTPGFGTSTAPGGLAAEIVFLPDEPEPGAAGSPGAAPDVRGKIVVASGMVSPDSALQAQRAQAAGLIHINETDTLHEMIATTIWGTPTTASADRIPTIPIVSIGKSDGDKLRAAAAKGALKVKMTTEVRRGWASIPLLVAEVPGKSPDFLFIATHVDGWYRGMTDTAGSVASILDMARVLQKHKDAFERGIRFCWWSGHSYGRYPGSTWYVDRFWGDLDQHAVAYTNLDGPGRRGSRLDEVEAGGWPGIGEYSRAFAERLTGKTLRPPSTRLFRPGRDSDSSFQGLGVPFFEIGVPGPPPGHPDVQPTGRIDYWHTDRDTIDKFDMKALELDTKYRVAQLYELATEPLLPLRIAPIAASYVRALDELAKAGGSTFDLTSTSAAAQKLAEAAERLDGSPRPTDPAAIASFNRLLVRVTHRLNSTLYTKAGRFDQDPAASVPMLPLLARVKELPGLPKDSDTYGFLETELFRGRNAVEASLREATEEITGYLGKG
jgi:N-acetylated-alpha-linked acidic dipeptidase